MHQPDKNYYPSLTGIRAIAAWMVFVHHYNFFSVERFGTSVNYFFAEMHIGVTLFFVLSGLLITLRYYDKPVNTGIAFRNYLVKRFARIYPMFFLIITLNFIWLLSTGIYNNTFSGGWKDYIGSITMTRGFFANFARPLAGQSWSITTEECFYFCAPFIFLLIKKYKSLLYILPVIFIALGILITLLFIKFPFHGFYKDFRFLFNFTFLGRCIEFFTGIGLALLYKRKQPKISDSIIYTSIGVFIILLLLLILSRLHTDLHYSDYFPLGIFINNLLLPLSGIAILFWGLLNEKNIITEFLSSSFMILAGKSSYIFYLIHVGIFMTVFYKSVTSNPIAVFIYLNIVSILLYKVIEHPLNTFFRNKFLKPEKPIISQVS